MRRRRGSCEPCNASIQQFIKKGSEKQFSLNSVVVEHIQSASTSLKQAATPQVEKSLKKLKKDELNLIADSSEEGWEVVNEYQRRDLANDNDDGKRIGQAEKRVSQKRRRAQSEKEKPPLRPQKHLVYRFPRCPSWFLVTELLSLRLIETFLHQALVLRTLSVPSIGLGAVTSLLEVSAISEISASSSKLSFPLANLTIVRRWTWMFVKSMLLTLVNINSVLALMLLRSMDGSQFILDVNDYGYRIPLHCLPPVSFSSNNISLYWRIPIL